MPRGATNAQTGRLARSGEAKKGIYLAEYNPHRDWGQFIVEDLTKAAQSVIVGQLTKKLNARLPDSKLIFTEYEVAVDELIKGNLNQAKTIVVTIPGGRIYFEDGTSAEQLTPTFEQPRIGRKYTLFLTQENACLRVS